MKIFRCASSWLLIVVLSGCASSNVTGYQPYQGKIDRPDRIIVYDFAATPAELAPEVAIAGQGAAASPVGHARNRWPPKAQAVYTKRRKTSYAVSEADSRRIRP